MDHGDCDKSSDRNHHRQRKIVVRWVSMTLEVVMNLATETTKGVDINLETYTIIGRER